MGTWLTGGSRIFSVVEIGAQDMTDDIENTEQKAQPSRITLWGVTGSGKSWMLNAFGRELEWYNKFDGDFTYKLYEMDERENALKEYKPIARLDSKTVPATLQWSDKVWIFERKFRVATLRRRVSSHRHKIIIHDNAGMDLTAAAGGIVGRVVQVEKKRVDGAKRTLEVADGVILLLDPTGIEDAIVASTSSAEKISQEDYTALITQVLELATKQGNRKLKVAVCLSKSDSLRLELPPRDLVEVFFGKELIEEFDKRKKRGVDVRYFRFSAVGSYFDEQGIKRPNLAEDGQGIANENAWNPVHAASPFFWMFEAIEKERVAQPINSPFRVLLANREKLYIPYAIRES
jgi:hypothetical protein